jgi:hypothetical protein
MMSRNRQDKKDRLRSELDFEVGEQMGDVGGSAPAATRMRSSP